MDVPPGRARVAVLAEHSEELGRRRWFIEDERSLAQLALGNLAISRDILDLCRSRAMAGLVARGLESEVPDLRAAALERLGLLRADDWAFAVADRLQDPIPWVRGVALRVLGELRAKEYAPKIIELLKSDESRRDALYALSYLGVKESTEAILPWVDGGDELTRSYATMALSIIWTERDVSELLVHSNPKIRRFALWQIHLRRQSRSFDLLVPLCRDPDSEVRRTALLAMGELDLRRAEPHNRAAMADDDAEVQRVAARFFIAYWAGRGLDQVASLMNHSDPIVRAMAVRAVSDRRDAAYLKDLRQILEDADENVRLAAADGLIFLLVEQAAELMHHKDPAVRERARQFLGR
jgi:HEAT repeat protein